MNYYDRFDNKLNFGRRPSYLSFIGNLALWEFRYVGHFSVRRTKFKLFYFNCKNGLKVSQISPSALCPSWPLVIWCYQGADMIKGEPNLGYTLELRHSADTGPRLHQTIASFHKTKDRYNHRDAGHCLGTWFAIEHQHHGHSELTGDSAPWRTRGSVLWWCQS